MEELFERFPSKEVFDTFFQMNYKPMAYEDVKEAMEALVADAGLDIFYEDYAKSGKVSKADFKEHLSQAARFQFEDAMTEAYYEKNPDVYEAAFGLYELDPARSGGITKMFHEKYQESYEALLDELFDHMIAPLLS